MPEIRFKEKNKKGHVLGLGVVTNEWREVSDKDLGYFEAMNPERSLEDYGIEVKKEKTTSKKEEDS